MASIYKTLLALASFTALTSAYALPQTVSTSTLPLSRIDNTGDGALPVPPGSPKYIILGLGFQNYTCSAAGSWVASTSAAGAIASLYDISNLVTTRTEDSYTKATVQAFEKCLKLTRCQPTTSNGFCSRCHTLSSTGVFVLALLTNIFSGRPSSYVGEHYFDQINGSQLPNFALTKYSQFFSGKKGAGVKAPSTSYAGQNSLGSVDWLYLVDNQSGRTKGLNSVYRVETAGGVAPKTCQGQGSALQVPYATEYWFY